MQALVGSKSNRSVLSSVGWVVERLPRFLFRRRFQILVDAVLSTLAIWFAYQLRFDFNVPNQHRVVMWTWALLLFFLRPLCLLGMGGYRGTWRYFNFNDARAFTLGALPATALMLLMRIRQTFKRRSATDTAIRAPNWSSHHSDDPPPP